jgi:hypothetical protein
MTSEQQGYVAYLLRLWQMGSGASTVWRVSLDDPRTGERKGFADLASLFAFLREQVGESNADVHPIAIQEGSNDV